MTRSNIDRAQALALSFHPWQNTPDDWHQLRSVVYRLGARAPKAARDTLAAHDKRQSKLPNPFTNARS